MVRFKVLSLLSVFLLVFGLSAVASADNAAQVVVDISYPCSNAQAACDTDVAVSRAVGGDIVNVYITLLDANGQPATAGPAGEALSAVTATLSSALTQPGSITAGSFATDASAVTFDTPTGSGSAARAQIDCTGATPGVDQLVVSVPSDPDPLVGNAEINIIAPPAASLVVRTPRNLSPPATIFDVIPAQLFNNNQATEVVGAAVPFYVLANDGLGNLTYAPELEGQQVTVQAYAEFSMNGNPVGIDPGVDGITHEMMPIAETTATFVNGVAQGTITINNGMPSQIIPLGLFVLLTASVDNGPATAQMNPAGLASGLTWAPGVSTADSSIDYVGVLSSSAFTKVAIGLDVYGIGTLIVPQDCINVLDNAGAVPVQVVLTDSLGNAVVSPTGISVDAALDTTLNGLLIDSGGPLTPGNPAWDIPPGSWFRTDLLADAAGVNDAGGVINGGLTISATGLASSFATVSLLPSNGNTFGATLVTDADALGVPTPAGTTVQLTIQNTSSGPAVPYLPVENGDTLEITATSPANGAQLLSLPGAGFPSAAETLTVSAVDEVPDDPLDPATLGLQISVDIYGPCTESTLTGFEPVAFLVTDVSKCDIAVSNGATPIDDIDPLAATLIDITGVDGNTADDLDADPVVITSPLIADGTTSNPLLAGDGTTNELLTLDEFFNVVDPAPFFTAISSLGVPTADSACASCPPNIILSIVYPNGAVGQIDTITCSTTGGLTRDLSITNIVAEGPSSDATALALLKEGPQSQNGDQIPASGGGEAIVRLSANGTGTANRTIEVSATSDQGTPIIRALNGSELTNPLTTTLTFVPALDDARLVISLPVDGIVTVTATDVSGTPLNPASLDVTFGTPPPPCTVAISPDSPTTGPSGTVQFSASTTGAGCNDPVYGWAVSASDCTVQGTIDADGLYTAPDAGACTETVTVTDTANGNVEASTDVSIADCTPVVTISPDGATLEPGASQAFTAETTCDSAVITGAYTWELDGVEVGTGATYTFNATTEGSFTLGVTDTQNSTSDSVDITVEPSCGISIARDTYPKSHWTPLPALIRIQTTGFTVSQSTAVTFDCASPLSVIKLVKLVNASAGLINQFAIISPAILTGNFGDDTETCTVSVAGCGATATIDLNILGLGIIPLSK